MNKNEKYYVLHTMGGLIYGTIDEFASKLDEFLQEDSVDELADSEILSFDVVDSKLVVNETVYIWDIVQLTITPKNNKK